MEFEVRERHSTTAILFSWEEVEQYVSRVGGKVKVFDDIKADGELTYVGDIVCKDSGACGYALYARNLTCAGVESLTEKLHALQQEREASQEHC